MVNFVLLDDSATGFVIDRSVRRDGGKQTGALFGIFFSVALHHSPL